MLRKVRVICEVRFVFLIIGLKCVDGRRGLFSYRLIVRRCERLKLKDVLVLLSGFMSVIFCVVIL